MNWYLKVLQQYIDFSGRARRKEYWMAILFHYIFLIGLSFLDGFLGTESGSGEDTIGLLYLIYAALTFIPFIAVGVRRMHDVGKSGWYLLIPIYSFILACTDSENQTNKWGANPKGIGNDDAINEIGKE